MHLQIGHKILAASLAFALLLCGCQKQAVDSSAAIEIVKNELHAGPYGGICQAVFKARGVVSAESNMDWCTVSIVKDTLEVNCERNNSISERHAVITLFCLGEKTSVVLSQDGQYSSLLNIPSIVSVGCGESKLQYDIETNVSLRVKCDAPGNWCRVGVNSSMVMFSIDSNPDMDARECKVTIYNDTKTIEIPVRQKGRFVFERTEPVVFPKHGGEIAIEFYSAEPYVITADDDWVNLRVDGDSLRISAGLADNISAASSAIHITTESGHSVSLEVDQKLLPQDYVGPFDFCFRSGWINNNQIYEYAVDAWWDEPAGQIVFDLVSYVLRFDYDPTDGQLYLSPQRAYSSTTNPYDTWLSIVGTQMLSDGSPDPSYIYPDPTVTDWTNYYKEGATFRKDYRMLFRWNSTLDVMTMTHCAESDFPIYRGEPTGKAWWNDHYGDPAYFVKNCYGFRLGLNHVYYNSMEDDRIDPDYMTDNHFPAEYRIDEHLSMYGPITLVRK